jgi:hypothetical protein
VEDSESRGQGFGLGAVALEIGGGVRAEQTTRCGGGATALLVGGLSVGVVGGSSSAPR